MKQYKNNQNQLLIVLLAVGFFVGILYENVIAKRQGGTLLFFQSDVIEQYKQTKFVAEEYFWYVVRSRVFPFILLCVLGCIKWKKALVSALMIWTGFLTGITCVSAAIQSGIKGILFCVAGIFPHMIFYGFAYGIFILYLYYYPRRQWNSTKTVFVLLLMFMGILLETYLSPMLLKWIL